MNSQTPALVCRGVRTHNLKGIDVSIPLGKWVAVTGVSGSGKSSLVFDTIYTESHRRFLETLGTYERQFLQGLPQGDFDEVENIPAAIALKQTNRSSDPRSLIGTAADIFEPLRMVFVALMDPSCNRCGSRVESHEPADVLAYLQSTTSENALNASQTVSKNSAADFFAWTLSVPLTWPTVAKKGQELQRSLMIEGFERVLVHEKILSLDDMTVGECAKLAGLSVEVLLDRFHDNTPSEELKNRIDTVWSQIRFSQRFSFVHVRKLVDRETVSTEFQIFRVQPYCASCQTQTTVIQSSDLDAFSVLGACPTCHGLGNVPLIDVSKVIPNPTLSLENGAIKPWTTEMFGWMQKNLLKVAKANGIKTTIPYQDLPKAVVRWIWSGDDPEHKFTKSQKDKVTLDEFFQELENTRYKPQSRILLAKYRKYVLCTECGGKRLGKSGRNAQCAGSTYSELMDKALDQTLAWVQGLLENKNFATRLDAIREIHGEVLRKLSLLTRLGLGSSTLSRRCKTLSGGEYQRVLLTRVLGNGLTDALYVLDEPSVGLGKSEIPELIHCLRELRDLGNTVLMVEHDVSLIQAADMWIELGPGGGAGGGQYMKSTDPMPVSSKVLGQKKRLSVPRLEPADRRIYPTKSSVVLENFSFLNCKNLMLEIPIGQLTVVVGPSGAGKSTLVHGGLDGALTLFLEHGKTQNDTADMESFCGTWGSFTVPKDFQTTTQVVSVEQRAMHRSIASVPATVLGLMDGLRKIFAATDTAKNRGLGASDFSFNGKGACSTCEGRGIVREDLFFLGDVEKICPDCRGCRYRPEVLAVQYGGKNIAEWMATSLWDARSRLPQHAGFFKPLGVAVDLGLGYLSLGLSTSSMSGGEAQRLRLAAALSRQGKKIFCLLDEPTRGLSEQDIGGLLETLLGLTEHGHTFVVVEHHEGFEKHAHQVIRLGPGGGESGGRITQRTVVPVNGSSMGEL